MKKLSLSLIALFSLASCSSPDMAIETSMSQNQTNVNASATKSKNSVVDSSYLKDVISSLDLNKDGKIDAKEAPILVGGKKTSYEYNNDGSAISGYLPVAGKEMTVDNVLSMMEKYGASLSVMSSKISEPNKNKIVSNLTSALLKDPSSDKGKITGFSTNIGYFTGKTTVVVRELDSSSLNKRIMQQLNIGNGTINGKPYQSGNGSISILANTALIDGKYKARLKFAQYDDFESGIQLFGYHKLKEVSVIEE